MKNFKYILGFLVLTSVITSCDNYDVEPVIDESAKPMVTATIASSSINESGSPTTTITINLDKPIKTTTTFVATQIGGSATEADFEVSSAVVPAYQTSTTMEISIKDDILVEGSENLELQISPAAVPDIYEVIGTPTVSLNIENSTSDDFVFKMDWDAIYLDADGHEHHLCDFDLDLEIYDADFNFIGASYSSCPEEIRFSPGDLPDGDYWLIPSFWSSGGTAPPAEPIDIPAVLTFAKPGVVLETLDLTGVWDTATGGYVQNNPDAYLVKFVLTISGSNYTVTDVDTGTVVFEG
ncbi:hypothetical protein [Aestuariivivens sp. NBU2969]|uniref:hypothetical protein n=1 Tax=Aestuariivivens sp. NBU2969 TaxID=2873267 RepID=UPI001CC005BA|nr:hypothetical protein [Aestuariivivens sp. NBU2969]